MILRFIKACFKRILSGFQNRSTLRIWYIFNYKCKPCPNFVPNKNDDCSGSCKICGCRLAAKGVALNKIAWRTEQCPDNPQRWK